MEISELTLTQVSDVIDGKHTELAPKDIFVVKNAYEAYSQLYLLHFDTRASTDPYSVPIIQNFHRVFMVGLSKEAGLFCFNVSQTKSLVIQNLLSLYCKP